MTVRLSTGLRTNLAGTTGFGNTFTNGVIHIYTGSQPITADSAVSGTLLGIVTTDGLPFAFGTATNGLTFDAAVAGVVSKSASAWRFTGLAAGTAGWFRLMANPIDNLGASTTLPRLDGSIATSGADLNLSNISVAVGAPNTIDVFSYEFPA